MYNCFVRQVAAQGACVCHIAWGATHRQTYCDLERCASFGAIVAAFSSVRVAHQSRFLNAYSELFVHHGVGSNLLLDYHAAWSSGMLLR
jgi:hypothetical protein